MKKFLYIVVFILVGILRLAAVIVSIPFGFARLVYRYSKELADLLDDDELWGSSDERKVRH